MLRRNPFLTCALLLSFFLLPAGAPTSALAFGVENPSETLEGILGYIANGWDVLTRSLTNCETVVDSRQAEASLLILPAELPLPAVLQELEQNCPVRIERLPRIIEGPGAIDPSTLPAHGLLYLPHPYVVPGGMFNEMYGWDSYFILVGLLRDARLDLAQGMVENFLFEIDHYGMILNANRTYFLSRSQPPFLTSMILAVFEAQKTRGHEDRAWLAKAYQYAVRDYELWVRDPHRAGTTGLSRYFDFYDGPSFDLVLGGTTNSYFGHIIRYFLRHPEMGKPYLVRSSSTESPPETFEPVYSLYLCNPDTEPSREGCTLLERVGLTADFYKGDRSMRESGFDISFRFGPFSGDTHFYAPVCLNSLLYKTETDLEQMSRLLGQEAEAERWRARAHGRAEKIKQYLWDGERGLFFDYNFRTGTRSSYEYASTFYPLWAGLATAEQARAVAANLPLFEQSGGLAMSRQETKAQWDYPYGWAPIQLIAIEGLRRYGYEEEANRLSTKFLSMVWENFVRDGTIREKYNVVTRSSETDVEAGYRENVIGFGWTNGVFLELLHHLPAEWKSRLTGAMKPHPEAVPPF